MPLHRSSGRWHLGLFLSLVTVLLWGVLAIALKLIVSVLDVYTVTWFRFLVSFMLLGIYLFATHQLPNLKKLNASSLRLLGLATLGLALNYILFLAGLNQTSPNNSQVLIQLAGLLFGFGSLIIFKERYTKLQWFGVASTVMGLVMFFHEQLRILIANASGYLLGSTMLVAASITWAVYALAQKQLLRDLSSSAIMFCIYGGSTLLFSPMATPAKILTISPWAMGILAFCALNTLIAYGAFAESLAHWEASRVSAVLSLTPLVTLASTSLLPLLWQNSLIVDPMTRLGWSGAVFVVLGSLTVSLGGQKTDKVN
jgi:drug/metabolite transporter (DMT)-like permease